MTKAEMVKYFKSRYPAKYEHGGFLNFTIKDDQDGYCEIRPQLFQFSDLQTFKIVYVRAAPRWYIDIFKFILAEKEEYFNYASMFSADGRMFFIENIDITELHLHEGTQMVLDWYRDCSSLKNISLRLKSDDEKHGSYKSLLPSVLKGDVERLSDYLNAFKVGKHARFLPQLDKQEYFERALELSQKYHSGELISPVQF